jgi:hypothetical protein
VKANVEMVQIKAGAAPVQFILDIKVRWSSTYLMLDCAEQKKRYSRTNDVALILTNAFLQCIDNFFNELHWEETDSAH